jgi:hypothetical protein
MPYFFISFKPFVPVTGHTPPTATHMWAEVAQLLAPPLLLVTGHTLYSLFLFSMYGYLASPIRLLYSTTYYIERAG